jgi:hypothetical protein
MPSTIRQPPAKDHAREYRLEAGRGPLSVAEVESIAGGLSAQMLGVFAGETNFPVGVSNPL